MTDFLRDAAKPRQSEPGDPLRWAKVRFITPKAHRIKPSSRSSDETKPPISTICPVYSVREYFPAPRSTPISAKSVPAGVGGGGLAGEGQVNAAVEAYPIGDPLFWTTGKGSNITWTAFGANDAPGEIATAAFDLVGDLTNRGLFWSESDDYVFFRMRVADSVNASSTWRGAHLLLIDVVGFDQTNTADTPSTTRVDWGFAWDSKSNDIAAHGLEMMIWSGGVTWDNTLMDDLDGLSGQKGSVDINGGGRTTDGYVRTSSTQPGNTTFVDFAVSWNYLATYVPFLYAHGDWLVTASSIVNATDHNAFDDVLGVGADLTGGVAGSPAWGSVTFSPIPEPTSSLVGILIAAGVLRRRRE